MNELLDFGAGVIVGSVMTAALAFLFEKFRARKYLDIKVERSANVEVSGDDRVFSVRLKDEGDGLLPVPPKAFTDMTTPVYRNIQDEINARIVGEPYLAQVPITEQSVGQSMSLPYEDAIDPQFVDKNVMPPKPVIIHETFMPWGDRK